MLGVWRKLHRRDGASPKETAERTPQRLLPGRTPSIILRTPPIWGESTWPGQPLFQCGVKEALHIHSRSPSLNHEQGRHYPPPLRIIVGTWLSGWLRSPQVTWQQTLQSVINRCGCSTKALLSTSLAVSSGLNSFSNTCLSNYTLLHLIIISYSAYLFSWPNL